MSIVKGQMASYKGTLSPGVCTVFSKKASLLSITSVLLAAGCGSGGFEGKGGSTKGKADPAGVAPSAPSSDDQKIKSLGLCPSNMPSPAFNWQNSRGEVQVGDFLQIERSCTWNETLKFEPLKKLTIWLVLDVSGSMDQHIEKVKVGLGQVLDQQLAKGWELKVGAIAFTDVIEDIIPATSNVESLLERMNAKGADGESVDESHPWSTPLGKGGDTPEAGIDAMSCALHMARSQKADCPLDKRLLVEKGSVGGSNQNLGTKELTSQWFVFVSDAPARSAHNDFESREMSASLSSLKERVQFAGGELRFYLASKNSRKGLLSSWPTPATQWTGILNKANAKFSALAFPVTSESIDATFVADAKKVPDEKLEHDCQVEEVGQTDSAGNRFNIMRSTESGYTVVKPPDGQVAAVYVQRLCKETGLRTVELSQVAY